MSVFEGSITVAKGYTFTVKVTDDGMVEYIMPSGIDPDDMAPLLTPEEITDLTATFSDDDRVRFGIAVAVMTIEELQEWGFLTLKASGKARGIRQGNQPPPKIEITDPVATAVLRKCITYEVYTESMPDTPARRFDEARSMLMFLIEAMLRDEVTVHHEDPDIKAMGMAIEEVLALAGIFPDQHDLEAVTNTLMTMGMP